MKIIVSSEAEKELIGRFIDFFNEFDCIEDIEEIDKENCVRAESQVIGSDEYCFIANGLYTCEVEVDTSLYPMKHEHGIVNGTCSKCGEVTEGTYDHNDVSYAEYLEYNSKEIQKNWLCEECARKGCY